MTLQDLIIISGIIFFIYKLITHEGKLTLARIVAMLGMAIWIGLGLLHEVVSIFVLFFWSSVVMGISLIGMYYIPSSEHYDVDKTKKHQKLFKRCFILLVISSSFIHIFIRFNLLLDILNLYIVKDRIKYNLKKDVDK